MAGDGVAIREMEIEDLPAVYGLGERLFTAEQWPTLYRTWDEYEVAALFSSDGDYCLVAEQGEALVGFVMGTLVSKRRSAWTYGWIMWLGVDPRAERQGVGRRLVDRLTEIFLEDGARMLIADTDADNAPALGFFEELGFGNRRGHVYLTKNVTQQAAHRRRRRASDKAANKRSGQPLRPGGAPSLGRRGRGRRQEGEDETGGD